MQRSHPKTEDITNFGKIGDAHFHLVPPCADCHPGLRPVEYNVIIATAKMPEKIGSLYIPDTEKDRLEMGMQVGRILDMSPIAFNYDTYPEGSIPQIGDLVWFARYAGGLFEGADGREYRMIKDKDIGAVIKTLPAQRQAKAA